MPLWLQIILGISATLVAIFGAYISFKQWKLSAYKLKHDLFERRWEVYVAAHDLIAITLNGKDLTLLSVREDVLNYFKYRSIKFSLLAVSVLGSSSQSFLLAK